MKERLDTPAIDNFSVRNGSSKLCVYGWCIDTDVMLLADDVIAYNGYYTFKLTKEGKTNAVHAKFSYIYKKDESGEWKIMIHNSGMTPKPTETTDA